MQRENLNIMSGDDEDGKEISGAMFEEGQPCDVCAKTEGRIGLDPTCRGAYDGTPVLYCFACAADGLHDAYAGTEGLAVVVEPFAEFDAHYYYRLDELASYQFVREDIEPLSWLMLTIGDKCARCGEQSRFAWLPSDAVDPQLSENESVFRGLDAAENLCGACTGLALARSCASLELPLMTVELPRSAMGLMMPTGD